MRHQPRYANRVVYAEVENTAGAISEDHIKHMFEEQGWYFEPREHRSYIVAIPLYCSRLVALQEARDRLHDFSQRGVPLRIQELRLMSSTVDRAKFVSVTRTSGNWVNLFWRKLRESKELMLSPLHWQISIPRSNHHDVTTRNAAEAAHAHNALEQSDLPGEPFDPQTMQIVTPAEPKNVKSDPWEKPWRLISLVVVAVLLLILMLAGATVAWLEVGFLYRLLAGVISAGILIFAVLWMTGNRTNKWLRLGTGALAFLALGFLSLVMSQTIRQLMEAETPSLPDLFRIFLSFGLIILTFTGWVHLSNVYPKVRSVWALPVISVLVPGAYAWAQLLINNGENLARIPADSAAVPAWVQLVATLYVMAWVGGTLLGLGGLFGWAVYFGFSSANLYFRVFGYLMALLLTSLFFLLSSITVLNKPALLVAEWKQSFENNATPSFTSEFLFRACLNAHQTQDKSGTRNDDPVVAIQDKTGGFWYWTIDHDDIFEDIPTYAEFDQIDIRPLPDQVRDCK